MKWKILHIVLFLVMICTVALAGPPGPFLPDGSGGYTTSKNITITGTLTAPVAGSNEVYGSGWNGDTSTPEKDDVYDYLHLFDADDDGDFTDEAWFPAASGAPTNAHYWTDQAEAGLSAEVVVNSAATLETAANLGAFFSDYADDPDAATMRTTLGLVIGTNVQAYDADLTTYAGITPSVNIQSLLGAANYAAIRTLLDLESGTDFNAYDADLTTYAGITPSANVQSLLGAADYAAIRTLLNFEDGADVTDATNVAAAGALMITNIDDVPVNGVTDAPISSNWAYDHEAAADPHTGYMLESNIGTGASNYLQLSATPGTPDGTKFLRDDLVWVTPAGAGDMTQAVYDIGANSKVDDADAVTTSDSGDAAATWYPTIVDGATGTQVVQTDAGLTFNPSTNTLTAGVVAGTSVTTGTQAITDNAILTVDSASAASGETARFTANGLESRSDAEMKSQLGYLTDLADDATPTLGAELEVGEVGVRLDETLSADGTWSGTVINGIIGYTNAFGDLVYLATVDQRWEQADASAEATAGDVMLAIALTTGTDGSTVKLLLQGFVREDDWNFTSYGQAIYISTTAGGMTQTAPSATTEIVRVIGYAHDDADTIYFNPAGSWVEIQ